MSKSYKTVEKIGSFELIEKKSRFIGVAFPAATVEEAMSIVTDTKKTHYNANHNCFAYQIEKGQLRSSDDGEPSGTAGKPMLEFIQKEEIENVVVIVTRYFGGIQLGTGGLVRAYGGCAKNAIQCANIITKMMYSRYFLSVDYHSSGKIQYEINNQHKIENIEYNVNVDFTILVAEGMEEQFEKMIVEITNGAYRANFIETIFTHG